VPTDPEHVTLREYFERLLAEHDKATALQFRNASIALEKAEKALTDRLAGMNEFRDQLREQAAQFATTKEVNAKFDAVDARLKGIENFRSNMEGRLYMIGAAVTLINVGVAVIGFAIKAK
jgi:hypothetical protein